MISKIFPYNTFLHNCLYVFDSPGMEVLESEGVREHSPELMASDFELFAELRPSKTRNCFHGVLSFYPGEQPEKDTMIKIAHKYMEALGICNTQYAIVLHSERPHLHLHIIANMIDFDGASISDSWLFLKGKKIAQQLTTEYNLRPAIGKNLDRTHLERMNGLEADRYRVYIAIEELVGKCSSLEDLEKGLLHKGIETRIRTDEESGQRLGIAFRIGKNCFKGSKVDRRFSLANLEKQWSDAGTESARC